MSENPLLQQLVSPITIRPEDMADKERSAKTLRLVVDTLGSAFQRLQNLVNTDPRMSNTRIAHGLSTMQGDVLFDYATQPAPGDTLFGIDGGRRAVWNAATSGGVTPTVAAHNLLSATHPDTVVHTPVLGDILYANATPAHQALAGNTTATRKFLRQTGTGAVSAAPVWDTLVAGDIPALATAGGWTDDGTIVRLTTSTDQVGIGTATPVACLGIVNGNNVADVIVKVTAKASQSGDVLQLLNSSARVLAKFASTGALTLGNGTDASVNAFIYMAGFNPLVGASGSTRGVITWGDNSSAIGPPLCTADQIGCIGARFYTYKDSTGQYDGAYGQDGTDSWVLVGDESITYSLWTGGLPGVITPFLRGQWAGNGDYTNYGLIHVRKSISAGTKGIPQLRLEETAAGTGYTSIRSPAVVTGAAQIQLLQDCVGTFVMVGDDPPGVASKALGKVDLTAQSAAIASTNLTNGAAAGVYLVLYTIEDTTGDVTAGTIQVQVNYTDTVGATTQAGAALALTATGRDRGSFIVQLASGELSYQTNLVGIIGSSRYAVYVRVILLG